ncbi:MAG: coniferyl aldehyde dehydrogenase [Aliivibrio sp.]|uniref:coniferyl aldehyde dehydrogenase n=1 Tax=Aliivibrio sp. TaxID=1872443 RepID=UPI001A6311B3|nr:coniferyl aldehyde dehydrogenase [Aliivibrio sp.]
MSEIHNSPSQLSELLVLQKDAYKHQPYPSLDLRLSTLKRLKEVIIEFQVPLVDALKQDYGHRSFHDSMISDIMPCINNIAYTIKHLKKWMKPSRRNAGILLMPAQLSVYYQPVGVIGIIVPWNFPVMLSIGPLITALAAGNRAILKLSEFTPHTNAVLKQMLSSIFDETQVATVEGDASIAAEFSSLAFDHILFTGSTTVGKLVMKAAAENLTPVTLELGGKSPVIIDSEMPLDIAVERLIYGKCLNAGQICVAPDYILIPKERIESFITAYQKRFSAMYGSVTDNADYSSVINQRQFDRLSTLLIDAETKGATLISANNEKYDVTTRKIPTQLVTDVDDTMLLMQDEIFGPILPIVTYDTLENAIDYVNQRPRPLALYIMSFDKQLQQQIIQTTHSGGVCINDTVMHVAADDAPFGGIGHSGMGHYHGKEGFLTLSHAKTVLKRGKINPGKIVHPPYRFYHKWFLRFFVR